MFKKLQLVVLGVVVLQAVGMNAMENKVSNSPRKLRNPLSHSQEPRLSNSGDFIVVKGLKRSLEVSKEVRNYTPQAYYPWPGANPEVVHSSVRIIEQMKPWYPHG